MLKQLRRKFIWVNMMLVALVLAVALSFQLISYQRQYNDETNSALQSAIEWNESGPDRWHVGISQIFISGENASDSVRVPTFCVILNMDGTMTAVIDNNVDITEAALAQAISTALTAEENEGELPSLGLKWLRQYYLGSLRIAFADTTWMRAAMIRQALTSLLVLVIALTGCFFVSLFLSRWILRPTERSWQQQQQFIADASHELKTPLTVMLADTDILLSHPEETIEDQSKWIHYIQDEATRMKGLVEDMLFLARSDSAAEKEVFPTPVSFSDICWSCMLSFEPVAYEHGAELSGEIDPGITVTGNEDQLRQCVAILLDNACKYCNPGGQVLIRLNRAGDRACLSVRNTGTPIPPDAIPHLFERFYRADATRDRESGGYGLGLSIADSIIRAHKGKISVTSTEEEGTVFLCYLPLEKGKLPDPNPQE